MPRPNACERSFEVADDVAHPGWARIALSSPVGLVMVAILAAGALTSVTPANNAESAMVAAAPFDLDRAAASRAAPRSEALPLSARVAGFSSRRGAREPH